MMNPEMMKLAMEQMVRSRLSEFCFDVFLFRTRPF